MSPYTLQRKRRLFKVKHEISSFFPFGLPILTYRNPYPLRILNPDPIRILMGNKTGYLGNHVRKG
jgi:hypothetical protein